MRFPEVTRGRDLGRLTFGMVPGRVVTVRYTRGRGLRMIDIAVSSAVMKRLEGYSNLSGQSIPDTVNEALVDFLDTTAEARIECIQEMAGKVISIELLKHRAQTKHENIPA